ncbi:hypothetical protein B0H13DRAFT_2392038 [Mycena leptocephala]|nr:hypothetical protein B0H13DRAFT_2392038 [Mycena leptocephala]
MFLLNEIGACCGPALYMQELVLRSRRQTSPRWSKRSHHCFFREGVSFLAAFFPDPRLRSLTPAQVLSPESHATVLNALSNAYKPRPAVSKSTSRTTSKVHRDVTKVPPLLLCLPGNPFSSILNLASAQLLTTQVAEGHTGRHARVPLLAAFYLHSDATRDVRPASAHCIASRSAAHREVAYSALGESADGPRQGRPASAARGARENASPQCLASKSRSGSVQHAAGG